MIEDRIAILQDGLLAYRNACEAAIELHKCGLDHKIIPLLQSIVDLAPGSEGYTERLVARTAGEPY